MSDRGESSNPDWTTGPAKWAAVIVLGAASIGGTVWSVRQGGGGSGGGGESRGVVSIAAGAPTREPVPSALPADPDAEAAVERGDAAGARAAAGAGGAEDAESAGASRSLGRKINLNTATAAELELLPGIGPAVARRIVDDRTAGGPFRRVDDLDRVKGIGPRTLDKLRDLVTVD